MSQTKQKQSNKSQTTKPTETYTIKQQPNSKTTKLTIPNQSIRKHQTSKTQPPTQLNIQISNKVYPTQTTSNTQPKIQNKPSKQSIPSKNPKNEKLKTQTKGNKPTKTKSNNPTRKPKRQNATKILSYTNPQTSHVYVSTSETRETQNSQKPKNPENPKIQEITQNPRKFPKTQEINQITKTPAFKKIPKISQNPTK